MTHSVADKRDNLQVLFLQSWCGMQHIQHYQSIWREIGAKLMA